MRWGKGRNWLEWLLKASDAAAADPERHGAVADFMDQGGAPNVAWNWIRENRDRPVGALSPLPEAGVGRELIVGTWKPSDVNVAGRALLAAALGSLDPGAKVKVLDPERRRARALTVIAGLWGQNGDWLQKIFDVSDAAEADPDLFGRLVGVMDKAGRPQAAWTRMHALHDERRVLNLVPTTGRFRTLVLDPPWKEDNISDASGHDYAQMGIDEIRALPVGEWAEDDAHLYLWLTNNVFVLACSLLEGWGFQLKSFHTWVKETDSLDPKLGLGREFRNTTEHFIFARRGSRQALPRRAATLTIPTHHRWPVGKNSEKPEGFYELVRASSYGPYGEAFQRLDRPDFTNLYQPAHMPFAVAAE